ncbi:hypothetical protein DFH29DRAFT_584105 [Suillus ampliporus]|nr:hypothetical protein DFH29DRAFT_584105 [Suillus ampliporus]
MMFEPSFLLFGVLRMVCCVVYDTEHASLNCCFLHSKFRCSSLCYGLYRALQLQLLSAATDCTIGFQHPFFGSHYIVFCAVPCRLTLVK